MICCLVKLLQMYLLCCLPLPSSSCKLRREKPKRQANVLNECRAAPRGRPSLPTKHSSGTRKTKREPSPDYVPQPSKKKRERNYSPPPSIPRDSQPPAKGITPQPQPEPQLQVQAPPPQSQAAAPQPQSSSPQPDIPDEVCSHIRKLLWAC